MQKLIALDIDGTAAPLGAHLAPEVCEYLTQLARQGCIFLFVTGRALHFAASVLKPLSFPYFLATYNGALILEMPSRSIVKKQYLDRTILGSVLEICKDKKSGFVIYAEDPHVDLCYFEPSLFAPEMLEYLRRRAVAFGERWEVVADFADSRISDFPSVKCFGSLSDAQEIVTHLEALNLHIPLIRDPFRPDFYVAQATHPQVDKGHALQNVLNLLSFKGTVIAAGDDYNDLPMLAKADVRIVMETAPKEIHGQADIIAPSAQRHGIIEGLQKAIDLLRN